MTLDTLFETFPADRGILESLVFYDTRTHGAITEDTDVFGVVLPRKVEDTKEEYFDIVFESDDPLDIKAFAVAAASDEISLAGDLPDEELTFDFGGMGIHNPFADETYGDWQGEPQLGHPMVSDGRAYVVQNPKEREWGQAYLSWRDGLFATDAKPKP